MKSGLVQRFSLIFRAPFRAASQITERLEKARLASAPDENMSHRKAISKTKSRAQSRAKDDQRAYDRRDSSFSVTPEVHSHLCGITETERQDT